MARRLLVVARPFDDSVRLSIETEDLERPFDWLDEPHAAHAFTGVDLGLLFAVDGFRERREDLA